MNKRTTGYIILIGVNIIYALTSIFSKLASRQEMLSWPYLLCIAGAVGIMGVYAILWQRIIAKIPISTAYMFKGTSLIFVLLFSALIFEESITLSNIIGALIIISGIAIFAKA